MVGIKGAEKVDSESWDLDTSTFGNGLEPSRVEGRSGSGGFSLGFQFLSKLTIGLPGLSLTTVGEGNFGLLSFIRILVAALMSSPRISMPFLVPAPSAGDPPNTALCVPDESRIGTFCL